MRAGIVFLLLSNAYWEKELYHKSARRPEIREDFRRAKPFPFASKKPQGFSML